MQYFNFHGFLTIYSLYKINSSEVSNLKLQGAALGTLLTIPAQFLVGRSMSSNNKAILECEDRSPLLFIKS